MNSLVAIKDVLLESVDFDGWLYIPNEEITLETNGIFIQSDKDADPNSEDHIPDIIKKNKWIATIDSETIEDIIFNAKSQNKSIGLSELFRAFVHYIKNDAFIVF
jgi:hypothetical protein